MGTEGAARHGATLRSACLAMCSRTGQFALLVVNQLFRRCFKLTRASACGKRLRDLLCGQTGPRQGWAEPGHLSRARAGSPWLAARSPWTVTRTCRWPASCQLASDKFRPRPRRVCRRNVRRRGHSAVLGPEAPLDGRCPVISRAAARLAMNQPRLKAHPADR